MDTTLSTQQVDALPTTNSRSTQRRRREPVVVPTIPTGDRHKRVMDYMPLLKASAMRLSKSMGHYLELDDLIGYGAEGLIEALDRYDPSFGTSFEAFAHRRIHGAMVDGIGKAGRYTRWHCQRFHEAQALEPFGEDAATQPNASGCTDQPAALEEIATRLSQIAAVQLLSIDAVLASSDPVDFFASQSIYDRSYGRNTSALVDTNPTPEETTDLHQVSDRVARALAQLPEKHRRLIQLYYYQDKTLEGAGEVLGLSKSQMCRVHAQAIDFLRAALAAIGDE